MAGIKIDEDTIIASRAVVIKNMEPNNTVAGNPAKPINSYF
ncbi:MAG: hypothetical protein ACRCVU_19435 [Flavobacterium sp.]